VIGAALRMTRVSRRLHLAGMLRLLIAALLLWVVASDTGPRLARMQYAALPGFDYAAEIEYLRTAGRFGEALVIADAGLEAVRDEEMLVEIRRQRELTESERRSVARRAGEVAMGAISGRGESLESLLGAIAADFFIVGDVRDLALEGGRYALDGEADEMILALSAIGLGTTLAPNVDWAPSLLKFARRAGTLTRGLAMQVTSMARAGKKDELFTLFSDLKKLAGHASPGGAVRLLRHADSAEDVAVLARFTERHRGGAAALHITGGEGAALVKGSARAGAGAAEASQAVILASAKGQHGVAWMRSGAWKSMMRPHVLVGISKGLWKGHAQEFVSRLTSLLDPHALWLLPLLAAWVFVELSLLARWMAARVTTPVRRDVAAAGLRSQPG
jgi:hypothetical protein